MSSSLYPWLESHEAHLLSQRERWPHAWLISGPEGIGKYALARWMAHVLLCEAPSPEGRPCGHCVACTWLNQHAHPDYYTCLPESAEAHPDFAFLSHAESDWIKLDAIRSLQARIFLPPHRHRAKVILIYPAELMNTAASNALLKLLEEPPAATTFLLVAHRSHLLLPTIRSRCSQYVMPLPSAQAAEAWCKENTISTSLLAEAGGCPLKAVTLKKLHESFQPLLNQLFTPGTLDVDSWKIWIDRVPKNERRTALAQVIDTLHKAVHDWLNVYYGQPPRFFPQQNNDFNAHLGKISIPKLLNMDHALSSVRQHIKHPLNPVWIVEDVIQRYAALWS